MIAPSELTGLGGVLGHGGWVALPLAVAAGWLVARAARLLHDRLARLVPRACRRFGCHLVPLMAGLELALVRSTVLARNLAGRAPPAHLV